MEEKMHFWYSAKMAEQIQADCDGEWNGDWTALIDGEEKPYTVCDHTLNHLCLWDDMEYLGTGVIVKCGEPKRRY